MTLSRFSQSISTVVTVLGLMTLSNLVLIDSAAAFSVTFDNGGFENTTGASPDGWTTTGDVTTNTGIDSINPISGSNQAVITNSYTTNTGDRNDDSNFSFNQSGTNPVDADTIPTNNTGDDLQTSLGLETDALSIGRSDGLAAPRTSKEGSGMYQDFTVSISQADIDNNNTNGFAISFDAAYLTNDGKSDDLGNQDFAFFSIHNVNDSPEDVNVLFDSDGVINLPQGSNNFNNAESYQTFTETVNNLTTPGNYTYRAAFGVADVDSYDRSSALMLDSFAVEQVPFEFSPTLGLLIVGGVFAGGRLRRHLKNKPKTGNGESKNPSIL
ncbi:MAG TPA: hypothetical protein V6C71_03675 [Coleofasciculaceae cyanobacterium]|jgi:hypothetical protein